MNVTVAALEAARKFIVERGHGDNCYLDGGHTLGLNCECGLFSVLAFIDSVDCTHEEAEMIRDRDTTSDDPHGAAEYMVEVMTAFLKGETIQFLHEDGHWEQATTPSWNWAKTKYRVKPKEPRTFYIALGGEGYMMADHSADNIKNYDGSLEIVKVREVLGNE